MNIMKRVWVFKKKADAIGRKAFSLFEGKKFIIDFSERFEYEIKKLQSHVLIIEIFFESLLPDNFELFPVVYILLQLLKLSLYKIEGLRVAEATMRAETEGLSV